MKPCTEVHGTVLSHRTDAVMHSRPYQQSHKTAVHPLGAHVTPLTSTYPLPREKNRGTNAVLNTLYCTMVRKNSSFEHIVLYCTMVRKNRWYLFITYPISLCCGSITFWCESGSGDPCVWLMDPDADPDPSIFITDLKDANKQLI